jgi:hypothetical protein
MLWRFGTPATTAHIIQAAVRSTSTGAWSAPVTFATTGEVEEPPAAPLGCPCGRKGQGVIGAGYLRQVDDVNERNSYLVWVRHGTGRHCLAPSAATRCLEELEGQVR